MSEEINIINNLSSIDLIKYFVNGCKNRATGRGFDHYEYVRRLIIQNDCYRAYLPKWVGTCRDASSFWNLIKGKYDNYRERCLFIDEEFEELFHYLETKSETPFGKNILFDEAYIHSLWDKALSRKDNDPEGAITAARSLLETVLKHILGELAVKYKNNGKLSELYREVAKQLNMAPEQHQEQIFKQILDGASDVVNGLGALRNKLGDAHGKDSRSVKPSPRHSELAVNLAGSMAMFIYKTLNETRRKT